MTILDTIVQSKRLQFPKSGVVSIATPKSDEHQNAPKNTNQLKANPFIKSLKQNGISIIGEIKPSSPTAGSLLEPKRLFEILELYKQQCTAISVLTDEQFFGGSFDLLAHVKRCTGLPVLCKDFIVSVDQISLAQKHGADAVLLIAKILNQIELSGLVSSALSHGLCPVVEINNMNDLQSIAQLPVEVVLINNRNLDTMQIDLDTTGQLASFLKEDQIVISASGIKGKKDIQPLLPCARRFLIGTSLMQSPAPATLLTELSSANQAECNNPRVKICGITNSDDANLALEAGAEFIGLIFVPSSKRLVTVEEACAIIDAVKKRAQIVGVFQNQNIADVNRIAEKLNLDFIQLHGEEDSTYVSTCVRPVIKAFTYSSTQAVSLQQLLEFEGASYFLFDLDKKTIAAKSAQPIDMLSQSSEQREQNEQDRFSTLANSLDSIRDKIPPFFLAGKLAANNVQQALQAVKPFAIDVASGVESSQRKKSRTLTKQFCNLAKSTTKTPTPQVVNK